MSKTVSQGILKTWKDDRGFGFIEPAQGGKDIFVHISAFKGMARRPVRGDTLYYEVAHDTSGKYKAINARIEGVEFAQANTGIARKWLLWLIAALLGLISAAVASYLR